MFKYITSILLIVLAQQCSDTSINNNYTELVITPKPFLDLPKELDESSGLEVVEGKIYSINDSGGKPRLFVFDTEGKSLNKIKITNAKNRDWESLAANSTHFYIGDFGNNSGNRDNLVIYQFPIEELKQDKIEANVIKFRYANQNNFHNKKKQHIFDGESLIALDNELIIFSKDWLSQATQVYHLPLSSTADTLLVSPREKMSINALITGADYDAKNKRLVLCGYRNGHNYLWLFENATLQKFLTDAYTKLRLDGLYGAQVESVAFLDDNNILISTEETKKFDQQMWVIGLDD